MTEETEEKDNPEASRQSGSYGAGKNYSALETVKKAQQATLKMARDWHKSKDTLHHAIKSYEDVIRIDPESPEADEARAELLKMAEDWDKKGQKYAAARLYKKLAAGK
jgi:Tfp pilus assembly protein PilF